MMNSATQAGGALSCKAAQRFKQSRRIGDRKYKKGDQKVRWRERIVLLKAVSEMCAHTASCYILCAALPCLKPVGGI